MAHREPKHGTLARYKTRKCRCDECRAANASYMRDRRNGVKHRGSRLAGHGNRTKYNSGCRCPLCRIAHSQYQAGYNAGLRAAQKGKKDIDDVEFDDYDESYGGLLEL